ncbi:hypothetical protein U1Q18_035178 [Sarracenia purpurea var. burkii]
MLHLLLAVASLGGAELSGPAVACSIVICATSACCLAWEFQGLGDHLSLLYGFCPLVLFLVLLLFGFSMGLFALGFCSVAAPLPISALVSCFSSSFALVPLLLLTVGPFLWCPAFPVLV